MALMVRETRAAPVGGLLAGLAGLLRGVVGICRATSRMAADICSMAAARESIMCWRWARAWVSPSLACFRETRPPPG